jgi:hypothetical protein
MQPVQKTPPAPVEQPVKSPSAAIVEALVFIQRQNAVVIDRLNSVRTMLQFFVVVLILAIVIQACTALLTVR